MIGLALLLAALILAAAYVCAWERRNDNEGDPR